MDEQCWYVIDMGDEPVSTWASREAADAETDRLNAPLEPGMDAQYDILSAEDHASRRAWYVANTRWGH